MSAVAAKGLEPVHGFVTVYDAECPKTHVRKTGAFYSLENPTEYIREHWLEFLPTAATKNRAINILTRPEKLLATPVASAEICAMEMFRFLDS